MIKLGYPTTAEAAVVSLSRPARAPRNHLAPVLLRLRQEREHGQLRVGCELVRLEQSADGIVASLRNDRSDTTERVEVRYLVGADGAHSTVRAAMRIGMIGADALAEFQMVQFEAPLADLLGEHRYGASISSPTRRRPASSSFAGDTIAGVTPQRCAMARNNWTSAPSIVSRS